MKKAPVKQPSLPTEKQTNFFNDVWDVVRQIPKGRVTSYGAIARYLGTAMSARTVGWALKSDGGGKIKLPAHRVVNRLGMLSGKAHFNPPEKMQQLLEKEGLIIKDEKIENFAERFWDPVVELGL